MIYVYIYIICMVCKIEFKLQLRMVYRMLGVKFGVPSSWDCRDLRVRTNRRTDRRTCGQNKNIYHV